MMRSAAIATGSVRASDAERERAVRALRAHFAAGRLDETELEARVSVAYAAVLRRDLWRLFRDLPRESLRERALPAIHRAVLTAHGWAFLTVNGGVVGAWAADGGGAFWPAAIMVPSTALLGWHAVRVRGIAARSAPRRYPG